MSNLSDLYDALVTAADSLSDPLDILECKADIDSWYAARQASDSNAARQIASYSIAGRSVSYSLPTQIDTRERVLWERVMARLYCRGIAYVDHRWPIEGPY